MGLARLRLLLLLVSTLCVLPSLCVSAPCSVADVLWVWKGALSPHGITFKLGLSHSGACQPGPSIVLRAFPELVANAHEKPQSSISVCTHTAVDSAAPVLTCALQDLPFAGRRYQYTLSLPDASTASEFVLRRGVFTTPPPHGSPFSFRFIFSSCADEDADPSVFHDMRALHLPQPLTLAPPSPSPLPNNEGQYSTLSGGDAALFFLHMGDLHYHNLAVQNVSRFRAAYSSLFASPAGRAMLELDLPFAYMWDDHDFGPDNSDRTAPGREAALQVYREMVPHYALAGDQTQSQSQRQSQPQDQDLAAHQRQHSTAAVHQAFTVGRVRFLLTDLRSHRAPNDAPATPSKSALGVRQKQWFKEELVQAMQAPEIALIVWCSTMPWHDDERKWGAYRHEQQELLHFMAGHGVSSAGATPLVIVSGDAHMLAVDDGRFSPGNLTVFHAAALGRPGSIKGGPYSHGVFPGSAQYGLMDVEDDGDRVCLRFQGRRVPDGVLLEYDTCHPERTPPNSTYYPPSVPMRKLQRAWKKTSRVLMTPRGMVVVMVAVLLVLVLVLKPWQPQDPSKKQR